MHYVTSSPPDLVQRPTSTVMNSVGGVVSCSRCPSLGPSHSALSCLSSHQLLHVLAQDVGLDVHRVTDGAGP